MTTSLKIDASRVENLMSPTLYGQFAGFMFEDIKGGLYAELLRDRTFDEAPDALGKVSLQGSSVSRQARIETLNSDSLTASNDFSHPDSMHVSTSQIEAGRAFSVTLPEHTVLVITLEVER